LFLLFNKKSKKAKQLQFLLVASNYFVSEAITSLRSKNSCPVFLAFVASLGNQPLGGLPRFPFGGSEATTKIVAKQLGG
jgi:hypothetical protein